MALCDAHHGLEAGITSINGKLDKILEAVNRTDKRVDKVYTVVGVFMFLFTSAMAALKYL